MPAHVDYDDKSELTFQPDEAGAELEEELKATALRIRQEEKRQATPCKDLLELESSSSFEKRLLVCTNGDRSFNSRISQKRGPPNIVPMPESSVLGRIKSFLPTLDLANRKLLSDIQDRGGDEFNIELANEAEESYVEMDLALGIADLHTPEAVAAAELVSNGQFVTMDQPGSSSESSSDSDLEKNSAENDMVGCLDSTSSMGSQQMSGSDHQCRSNSKSKRKKIELL